MTTESQQDDAVNTLSQTDVASPNDVGVYKKYQTEVVARHNRSAASVDIAQCTDGMYRFSVSVMYSYGGFSGPITDKTQGHETYDAARKAGVSELMRRFPKGWPSDPHSVHVELEAMRKQLEEHVRQPTLF